MGSDSKPGILSCPEIFPQFAKPLTGSKLSVTDFHQGGDIRGSV